MLSAARNDVTLVESDDDRVAELRSLPQVRLLAGDAFEPNVLADAGALTSYLVMAATGRDEDNLVISLLAKGQFGVGRVAARVNEAAGVEVIETAITAVPGRGAHPGRDRPACRHRGRHRRTRRPAHRPGS
ncbi:hypothetical protein GCM10010339_80660 [Streptomyces alanosinicus]|uniref:RCK N-terminal domain-containing protein n=1 Tax=Streptomyces alanosinicus TaxID=68171 RepID=A0A919D644_9ACTN|nr:NAD-binding protein [Streptomyces alanosinicus]GHE13498.1 hypothetical protein GCM10010339_80660 [Streptomyces alanosinicus]